MHFYNIGIDSENLPSKFKDAALLLYKWTDSSTALGSPEISFNASLQVFKHYLGLFCSKYKKLKYSAAEKLCGAYLSAASKRGVAFLAESFKDSASKNIEFAYF